MFYHGLGGLFMSLVYLAIESVIFEDHLFFLKYTAKQYFIVILACLCDVANVFASLKAAQSSNLGFVGLISYTQIIYAFMVDLFFFN